MLEQTLTRDLFSTYQGMDDLKVLARKDEAGAVKEVARQFEAIFMQMMLKSMRDASMGDSLFDSNEMQFYQQMMDQQLSMNLSQNKGLGLADLIVRQLQGGTPTEQGDSLQHYLEKIEQDIKAPAGSQVSAPASAQGDEAEFDSPAEFINTLWPLASKAGAELGLPPGILIAQAALETGWGKYVIGTEDAGSSHNLFNIKADSGWQGERLSKTTMEFLDGKPVKRWDPFRAYASFEESFQDYVDFLKANPRYQQALHHGGDEYAFIDQVHRAGYATDPDYSNKIKGIYDREILPRLPDGIKDS